MARKSLLLMAVLLLVPLVPAGPAASPGWPLQDPADDLGAGPVPSGLSSGGLSDTADFVGASLRDDEAKLVVELKVKDLRVGQGAGCCVQNVYISGGFEVEGSSLRHWLHVRLGAPPGAEFVVDAQQSSAYSTACGEDDCHGGPVPMTLDAAANTVRLDVPKTMLLGQFPGGRRLEGGPLDLPAGARLLEAAFYSSWDPPTPFLPLSVTLDDRIPDEDDAPPYLFEAGAANAVVSLDLPSIDGALGVQTDTNQTLRFTARNDASGKRILNLAYKVDATSPAAAARYVVDGPRTITLASLAERNFTFTLKTLPGTTAEDGARLTLRATSTGHPNEIALAAARLVATPALGPLQNVLYFQSRSLSGVAGPVDSLLCHPALPTSGCENGFLSAEENPPGASAEPIRGGDDLDEERIGEGFFLILDRPSPTPLAFDRMRPVELELHLKSAAPASGVRFEGGLLWGADDAEGTVATFEGELESGPDGSVLKTSAPVELREGESIAAGNLLGLFLLLEVPHGDASGPAFLTGGFEIQPKASRIILPLTELPPALRPAASASPVQLSIVGSNEEFVNPGEATRFGVSLLNQAEASTRVELATVEVPSGWTAEIRPGARYVLEPGDVVTFDLLLTPSKDAMEGDFAAPTIEARVAGATTTTLLVRATVATGVDLDDDSEDYVADLDAQSKLEVAKGSSPGAGLLAIVAAIALAWRRRGAA